MINVICQLLGTSGYASHARGLVNELNKLVECKIITNLTPGFERDVNDAELEMIKREEDYEINLIITHPLNWRSNLTAKRNFVYLIFEGDKIPKWMLEECMNPKIEKIICPSQHTFTAVINTIEQIDTDGEKLLKAKVASKLVIIPHGHDPKVFYPISQQKAKDGQTRSSELGIDESNPSVDFKFLANKGLRNLEDRGGIQYLIEAYISEFTESNPVELILKINPAYGIPNLLKMFPNLKKKGVPKIRFIPDDYTTKQLNELYNECDVFVSPNRSESFNLPGLEAQATGLCTIQTNFGGQLTYMKEDIDFFIDYKLVPVTHEIEYEETMWSVPDHNHLRKLLRYTFEHQDEIKQRGQKAIENAKRFTWNICAKKIKELI